LKINDEFMVTWLRTKQALLRRITRSIPGAAMDLVVPDP
jgi:hypothetical protein